MCATIVKLNYQEPKIPEAVIKTSDSQQNILKPTTPDKNAAKGAPKKK